MANKYWNNQDIQKIRLPKYLKLNDFNSINIMIRINKANNR